MSSNDTNAANPFRGLKRSELEALTVRVLHSGKGYQSSVRLIEKAGRLAAVKDYMRAPRWFRTFVAPLLLNREERALRVLEGTPGVPRFFTRIDRLAMVMEFIEGTPMDKFSTGQLEAPAFEQAQKTIDAVHARGVAHCDLKRRANLILTPSGQVYLIDFAASVVGKRPLRPFVNWLQRQMTEVDNKSVPRLKKFVRPDLLTEEDKFKLDNPTSLEKWARKLLNR